MGTKKPDGFKVKEINHIGMVVKDLDKVVKEWSENFGFGPWSFADIPGMRVGAVFVGSVEFEIAQPLEGYEHEGAAKMHTDYLEAWGDGVHHVGFAVDDVEKEVAGLKAKGVKVVADGGATYAYVQSGDPGSMIFEFMNRGVYNLIKEKGLDGLSELAKQNQAETPGDDESKPQ